MDKFYREQHKEKAREYLKVYNQNHLEVNGKNVIVHKRKCEDICELCLRHKDSTRTNKLDWHHWNDEHPEWGLWLCRSCHYAVEFLDEKSGVEISRYRKLKEMVEHGAIVLL